MDFRLSPLALILLATSWGDWSQAKQAHLAVWSLALTL